MLCRGAGLGGGALCFLSALPGESSSLFKVTELPRLDGIEATDEIGALRCVAAGEFGALGLEFPLQFADLAVARTTVLLEGLDFRGSAHISGFEGLGALVRRGELLAGQGEGSLESAGPADKGLLTCGEFPGLFLECFGPFGEFTFPAGQFVAPFLPGGTEGLVP